MLGRDELRNAEAGTTRRLLLWRDGQLHHGIVEPTAVRRVSRPAEALPALRKAVLLSLETKTKA